MNRSMAIDEVLIIDDDVISLYAQQQLLDTLDIAWQVTALEDGRQALAFIREQWMAQPASLPPAKPTKLLLLDLRMPDMSGMEFLEQFAQLPATDGIAIVVLSSIVPDFIRKNAETFHVIGCFDKPLTKAKVEDEILPLLV